jgi:hypothetical protein
MASLRALRRRLVLRRQIIHTFPSARSAQERESCPAIMDETGEKIAARL